MSLLISICCLISAWVCFSAALGLCRFPDAICRLHATGKAGTLGALMMSLAMLIQFPSWELGIKIFVVIGLFLVTSAQVAQVIGNSIVHKKETEE